MSNAVSFRDVRKLYRLGRERMNLRAMLPGRLGEPSTGEFHAALDGFSFELAQGGSLGIIGPNGAGKSTTLKLVAGVITATSGAVDVHGRTASLIELGAGFHPDMTGRENVYFSAAVLGMGPRAVRKRFDEIAAFAGIDEFLDSPVKRYSSGMLARLGFAVASHIDADILVLDEVLAVGDAEFQRKCYERIRSLVDQGVALLYVTHALFTVPMLCERAVLLVSGTVAAEGDPTDVVHAYERLGTTGFEATTGHVLFTDVMVSPREIEPGDSVEVRLTIDVERPYPEGDVMVMITDVHQETLAASSLRRAGFTFDRPGTFDLECHLSAVALQPDQYQVFVAFLGDHRLPAADDMRGFPLEVAGERLARSWGRVHLPAEWRQTVRPRQA